MEDSDNNNQIEAKDEEQNQENEAEQLREENSGEK